MHIADGLISSIQNIMNHKLRSILTLLGIIIGVFAVVTMFSSVYGVKTIIAERMEGMGWNNSIIIRSATERQPRSMWRRMSFRPVRRATKPLSYSDYHLLRHTVEPKYAYGIISTYERMIRQNTSENVYLTATNNDFFLSRSYFLKEGRFFNQFEDANAGKVCILGYHFVNDYFPDEDIIGNTLTIGNNRYKVIGIMGEDLLNTGGFNFNPWQRRRELSSVYIPLSTGARYLRQNSVDYIYLQSHTTDNFRDMMNRARQTLLAQRNMSHDFEFDDIGAMMLQITEEMDEMMEKWNITLSAIASISLIVGGIGLFSILMISINERMTEIGVRKSIGAKERDIFLLFLMESLTLAIIAAVVGISFAALAIGGVSAAIDMNLPIPIEGVVIGLGFSIIIGILSGIYPAIKASRINPITAIYYYE